MKPTRTSRLALTVVFAAALGTARAVPVINEIMPNPNAVADSAGEWFEVFNPGSIAIDLDGWHLADNAATHRIDNGGPLLIAPGATLVFGRDDDPARNGGITLDYRYDGLLLANSGDVVRLLDAALVLVDEVVYDTTFPFAAGVSMALVDALADNTQPAAWRASTAFIGTSDSGSPGLCNTDVGQVCAVARLATGVPAPPTVLLVALGVVVIGTWHRRCRAGPGSSCSATATGRRREHEQPQG